MSEKNRYSKYYHKGENCINYSSKEYNPENNFSDVLCRKNISDFVKKNERYGIKGDNIYKDVQTTLNDYGLDINFITGKAKEKNENNQYRIPKLSEEILALMIWDSKSNPVNSKQYKKIKLEDIINHNNQIYEKINKLPKELQNNIKCSETYKFNRETDLLMKLLSDRINLLLNILLNNADSNSGNQLKRLIVYLDEFLYSYAQREALQDELREEGKANYSLESLFKEEFLKSIKENVEILDLIKTQEYSIKNIKEDLENIKAVNTRSKTKFDSDDLHIYYKVKSSKSENKEISKAEWKNQINESKKEIFEEEEIKSIEKDLKKIKRDKKYYYNDSKKMSPLELTSEKLEPHISTIVSIYTQSYVNKENIFDNNYIKYSRINIYRNYMNEIMINFLFLKYPRLNNEEIKKVYKLYILQVMDIIEEYIENNDSELNKELFSKKDPFFSCIEINKKIEVYVKEKINEWLELVKENYLSEEYYFEDTNLNTLKKMYDNQEKKISKIDKKIKNSYKITKEEKLQLEKELQLCESIKGNISELLADVYIKAIYNDNINMKKEYIDLKSFLKNLDF